jgi:hypothetical protein
LNNTRFSDEPGRFMKKTWILAALVLAVALIAGSVRLVFWKTLSNHPVSRLNEVFLDSDLCGNLEWADSILSGDVFGIDTWHPYHSWMRSIGTPPEWAAWWGSAAVFQQAPLYPYFLAAVLKAFDGDTGRARLVQHFFGAVTAALVACSALLLFGPAAALFAGIGAALYHPFLCFEFYFLRDFLAVHLLCWLILLLVLARRRASPGLFLAIGAVSGLCVLARENLLVAVPAAVIVLARVRVRAAGRKAVMLALAAAGFFLVFVPLFYRNLVAGAPPCSLSNRLIESLIEGNAFDSTPVFMCLPESMSRYLREGAGDPIKTCSLILADYPGPAAFAARMAQKAFYLFYPLEPYNNLNLYFFLDRFPAMRLLPRYTAVFLAALPGMILALRRRRHRYLFLLFALLAGSLLLGPVLARYRLILVPFYLLWGGLFFQELVRRFSPRTRPWLVAALLVLLAGADRLFENNLPARLKERDLEDFYLARIRARDGEDAPPVPGGD